MELQSKDSMAMVSAARDVLRQLKAFQKRHEGSISPAVDGATLGGCISELEGALDDYERTFPTEVFPTGR